MKVLVYNFREFDEKEAFEMAAKKYGVEIKVCKDSPSLENACLAEGCDCISIVTTQIQAELIDAFKKFGIKYISTRTIGYDHVDVQYAKGVGISVGNATYGPEGVADYAIMLMLMTSRKMKAIMNRAAMQDFSLQGIQGRELPDLTVGIIGTGRIGKTVIRHLSGFGCKVLAYDVYQSEEVKQYATYVELETLLKEADLISLHTPLTEENYHIINQNSIGKMKDNVILVNTARGALIDSEALIEGLENGKIGAVGLDVVENEFDLYYFDLRNKPIKNRELAILKSFPNAIVTPHMAFYTDNAINSMAGNSIYSCCLHMEGKENPWEV